jgi:hypothetical protein
MGIRALIEHFSVMPSVALDSPGGAGSNGGRQTAHTTKHHTRVKDRVCSAGHQATKRRALSDGQNGHRRVIIAQIDDSTYEFPRAIRF